MILFLGNLTIDEFARRVGAEFTADETDYLESVWSRKADLTGPDDWHIFDGPTVAIGCVTSRTVEIFKAANGRKTFNQPVQFHLDERWKEAA